jgi:protein-S-isoprenylcysteine O-methyltransferase Ste14
MGSETGVKTAKRSFWAVFAFYALIAFEFLYMSSPFAIYFYSVYKPALSFLSVHPVAAWLSRFFIPHIAIDTRFLLLSWHNQIGFVIAITGFAIFCICAFQVYWSKLKKKGGVMGGLYRYIRHPQYAGFMLCSFGMMLIWPRFLVLVMLVLISFVYWFLARAEEKECETKFGPSYTEYKNRTGMFLPFRINLPAGLQTLLLKKRFRIPAIITLFVVVLSASLGGAILLQRFAVSSLYTLEEKKAVWYSVAKIDDPTLQSVHDIALSDSRVSSILSGLPDDRRLIVYILPQAWTVPEVPSVEIPAGHHNPSGFDKTLWKVSITRAVFPGRNDFSGNDILMNATNKELLAEVRIDLVKGAVTRFEPAGSPVKYQGIPVPVY